MAVTFSTPSHGPHLMLLTPLFPTVVNHLAYDAFGQVISETNAAIDSLCLFTARPSDSDAGIQFNLNRWYDRVVGRWLSEDPIGLTGAVNLYEYAGNSPTMDIDPTGLLPVITDILKEAERRRGRGKWKDSAQHCWAACYIGAKFGAGTLAALVADIAEAWAPGDDSVRDVIAQHVGAAAGETVHRILWPYCYVMPERVLSRTCDNLCQTSPKR